MRSAYGLVGCLSEAQRQTVVKLGWRKVVFRHLLRGRCDSRNQAAPSCRVSPCPLAEGVLAGKVTEILVPRAFDSIVSSPWTCLTRSRIPLIPTPVPWD